MRIARFFVSHWRGLIIYPGECSTYRERVAFEKGLWDGRHLKPGQREEDLKPRVRKEYWEIWRTGFSVTAGY